MALDDPAVLDEVRLDASVFDIDRGDLWSLAGCGRFTRYWQFGAGGVYVQRRGRSNAADCSTGVFGRYLSRALLYSAGIG